VYSIIIEFGIRLKMDMLIMCLVRSRKTRRE